MFEPAKARLKCAFVMTVLACTLPLLAGCADVIAGLIALPVSLVMEGRPERVDRRNAEQNPGFLYVGRLASEQAFPAGALYVQERSITLGKTVREATLIINLDAPTSHGERSYAARTKVNCETQALAITYSRTSSGQNDSGNAISLRQYSPGLEIGKPSEVLVEAILAICEGSETASD